MTKAQRMRRGRLKSTTLLVSLALLTGCEKTPEPVPIATDKLCQSWKHATIEKADRLTDRTASKVQGNNDARPEWGCEYGENRAKG